MSKSQTSETPDAHCDGVKRWGQSLHEANDPGAAAILMWNSPTVQSPWGCSVGRTFTSVRLDCSTARLLCATDPPSRVAQPALRD